VREYSALALGVLGDSGTQEALRGLLNGRQGEGLGGAAAIALGLMRDVASAPELRTMSRSAARDENARGYAVLALAMLGDPVTRNQVRDLSRKPGAAGQRRSSTLALGMFPRLPAGRAILASLLEDGDPYVRGASIASLTLTPRASVADMLLVVADSKAFTREARLDALSALGVLLRDGRPSRVQALTDNQNHELRQPVVDFLAGVF
jgi:HEAT repeat protein